MQQHTCMMQLGVLGSLVSIQPFVISKRRYKWCPSSLLAVLIQNRRAELLRSKRNFSHSNKPIRRPTQLY